MPDVEFDVVPCYLGTGVDMLILGIIGSQFMYWALRREKEEWYIRSYMIWTFMASIVHSGFVQAFGYTVFISNAGIEGWWIKGLCLFEIVLAGPVELVYAWRAYNLWERPRWYLVLMALLFANFFVVGIVILAILPTDTAAIFSHPLFTAWIVAYIVLECSLTLLIVIALWRKRSGIVTSDRIMMRTIILSAEAQLFPCLIAIGIITWVRTNPHSSWIFMFFCAPKLWVVTCNIVINSRKRLRRRVEKERERRQNTLNTHPDLLPADEKAAATSGPGPIAVHSLPELNVRYTGRPKVERDGQMSFEEMLHSA